MKIEISQKLGHITVQYLLTAIMSRAVEYSMVRYEHFEYPSFSNIEVFDIRCIRFFEVFDID